ncbi:MAG: glutamate-ammonia-ligase adenylyltransferase, partial [Oceanicoccus sp.]
MKWNPLLVTKIRLPIEQVPQQLMAEVEINKTAFVDKNPEFSSWFLTQLETQEFSEQLVRAWSGSRYACDLCIRQPEMFMRLVDKGDLFRSYDAGEMTEIVTKKSCMVEDFSQLNRVLRHCRAREMLRIIWRDLNGQSDLLETTADVSSLAEVSIQLAVDFHHQQLSLEYGIPSAMVDEVLIEQKLIVLGMGKLGASELNLSSDIDLIFSYPKSGLTVDVSSVTRNSQFIYPAIEATGKAIKYVDNHEFFTRLGQRVITSLDKITEDGFVFRVDMRLRPYGESGALVLCFDAFEEYYQDQGRDWERYAMIKARIVAGDQEQGQILLAMLRPFVYRRYIDYSVIDSLRSMKKMIKQEVKRRRLGNDVKLGQGGIRDVEFIVQSFQLIRGGRDTQLQERRLLSVLDTLEEDDFFSASAVEKLREAYFFLRNTEHVIQAFNDRQTQLLPVDAYPQSALAFAMGFENWDCFIVALSGYRNNVSEIFKDIFSDNEDKQGRNSVDQCWVNVWSETLGHDESVELLVTAGHELAEDVMKRLKLLKNMPIVLRMQAEGRDRLDLFMPMLLLAVNDADRPSATLLRIFPLVESVLRRTAYLILLAENPGALRQLVILCAGSPWVATQLA